MQFTILGDIIFVFFLINDNFEDFFLMHVVGETRK